MHSYTLAVAGCRQCLVGRQIPEAVDVEDKVKVDWVCGSRSNFTSLGGRGSEDDSCHSVVHCYIRNERGCGGYGLVAERGRHHYMLS
jgi:hypothetical protein